MPAEGETEFVVSRISAAGDLNFGTFVGGNFSGYSAPTDVTMTQFEGTAESPTNLYLLVLGSLAVLAVGVFVSRRKSNT